LTINRKNSYPPLFGGSHTAPCSSSVPLGSFFFPLPLPPGFFFPLLAFDRFQRPDTYGTLWFLGTSPVFSISPLASVQVSGLPRSPVPFITSLGAFLHWWERSMRVPRAWKCLVLRPFPFRSPSPPPPLLLYCVVSQCSPAHTFFRAFYDVYGSARFTFLGRLTSHLSRNPLSSTPRWIDSSCSSCPPFEIVFASYQACRGLSLDPIEHLLLFSADFLGRVSTPLRSMLDRRIFLKLSFFVDGFKQRHLDWIELLFFSPFL